MPATRQISAEIYQRREQALDWVAVDGPTRDDGSPQPVLTIIDRWETKLLRLLEQHGGTPMAQAVLAEKMAQVQTHAWNLEGLAAAGRAAISPADPKALEPPTSEADVDDDCPRCPLRSCAPGRAPLTKAPTKPYA